MNLEPIPSKKTSGHPPQEGGVREVKSAARTVEVLEYLAARSGRHVRLREISEALGVPRSSLHALLRTLVDHGWVRSDASATLYSIGIRALLAGTSYLDSDPYLPLITPFLDELHEQLDETFHLGRLDGTNVVYLATRESTQYLRSYSRVGRRLPAYATSLGKVLLADLEGEALEAHLPRTLTALTPHTIVDREDLAADLASTRSRGYAVDQQESSLGLQCFAVALRYAEPATDAISASVPTARLTDGRDRQIVEALAIVAQKAARAIGPREPTFWR